MSTKNKILMGLVKKRDVPLSPEPYKKNRLGRVKCIVTFNFGKASY